MFKWLNGQSAKVWSRGVRGWGVVAARLMLVLLGGMMMLGVAGCERKPGEGGTGGAKGPLRVVCTVGMITDGAKVIARGTGATVTGLMGAGVDPHLYKASPGDTRLLAEADVIFYGGLLLEGRMVDVLVKMAGKKPTVAVTERMEASALREPPEFQGHPDPHVWFDVSLWREAVMRMRDALMEHDAARAAVYAKNAEEYLAELDALHEWCKSELGKIPPEKRVLVTAHDAFGYFGRAYGLEVLAIQGISTDSEASLRDLNGLVDLLVSRKIPAVFVESTVPRKTIEALVEGAKARGHSVVVGGELFSDAMGTAGTEEGTYIGMVRHNVRTIVAALAGAGGKGTP